MVEPNLFEIASYGPRCKELGLENKLKQAILSLNMIIKDIEGCSRIKIDIKEPNFKIFDARIEIEPVKDDIIGIEFEVGMGINIPRVYSYTKNMVGFYYLNHEYEIYCSKQKNNVEK